MVRAGRAHRARADADHHRRGHLPVRHVAQLRRLQRDLPGGLEQEVGEHQVGNAAHARRRGAKRRAGEAKFGDRRVDHPVSPELLVEPLGVGEGAAALAGSFAEIDDVRIAPHLLGDAVAHGVEPARLLRRDVVSQGRECFSRVDRVGIDMQMRRRRVRLRRTPCELDRFLDDAIDLGLDRLDLLHGDDGIVLDQLTPESS